MAEQVREATQALLKRKPALRTDIETLVDRDAEGPWEFQDVAVDSGSFGEIVESGLVQEVDGGYRLTDRSAVQSVLDEDATGDSESSEVTDRRQFGGLVEGITLPDRRRVGFVLAALALVALARIVLMVPSVFRPTGIVLAGNDPYMYHHIVEQLLVGDLSAFSPGDLSQLSVEFLQFEVRTHDTLFIVVLWWFAAALGGQSAVGAVIAWYPVAAALVTALVVYGITMRLTEDVRCGLASILLLAITPAHAYRTALGFGDHHAFDYVWLGVTALAVTLVATERLRTDERRLGISPLGWAASLVGGIGIAAQSAAWRGGPLLILPIALYAIVRTYLDVREGESPVLNNAPLLGLTGIGAVTTLFFHVGFNWLEPARAFAPALLFVGVAGVVAFAELIRWQGFPAWTTVAGEAGGAALVLFVLPSVFPPIAGAATSAVSYFQTYGGSGIAETQSLFSGDLGAIVAPIFLFGFVFFLALPYLAWATWQKAGVEARPDWLAVVAYAWWLFLMSIVQNRFSGELSLFTAVFAGIGLVHVAAWVDLARPLGVSNGDGSRGGGGTTTDRLNISRLDSRTLLQLVVLFLLVGSLGGVQTVVKTQQVAVSDADYRTGIWLEEYATERGLSYPDNYVLSLWGRNRLDNYLVNGETESYDYAQENYGAFVRSPTTEGWYQQFAEDDVGFVLVRGGAELSSGTVYAQLTEEYGSRAETNPAVEHFRAIYTNEDDSRLVYEVVPGATVTGTAQAGTTVTAETTTTLPPTGKEVTYTQQVEVGSDGSYQFVTPYPGTYDVAGTEATVPESAVVGGNTVSADG